MLHSVEEQVGGVANAGDEKTKVEAIKVAQSEAIPTALRVLGDLPRLTKPPSVAVITDLWLALLEIMQ